MEMQSSEVGELAAALAKAQSQMRGAVKDSTNPFFKSKYADLSSVWDACRVPLSTNGLAIVQTTDGREDGVIEIITTLIHSSGEWMRGRLPIRPMKQDPQSTGSAITYGRRFALASMVGVCPSDDDAEVTMGRTYNTSRIITINKDQVMKISNLVNQLGVNQDDFMKWLRTNPQLSNIKSYSELPQTHFNVAMEALNKKRTAKLNGSKPLQTTH